MKLTKTLREAFVNAVLNDAARGVMEAIYAVHMLRIYLVAEVLTK